MRFFTLLLSAALISAGANAQSKEEAAKSGNEVVVSPDTPSESAVEHTLNKVSQKVQVKYYGFVRNYLFFDSRKNVQSSGGQFNQIPNDQSLDENGEDLNEVPSSRLLSITTRLGLNLSGPEALGAATSGKIEADFNGFSSSTTMLRIRHAYVKLDWGKHEILCGQTWHPMTGTDLPDVIGLATGSPFNPFSRAPQLAYKFKSDAINVSLSALYQLQNTSAGPNGASAEYAVNNVYPEIFIGLSKKIGKVNIEIGTDIQSLMPRTQINENGTVYKVDDRVTGISPMLYLTYKGPVSVKFKTVYGQNTSHLSMMSGYGISDNGANGKLEYETIDNLTSFVNLSAGKKHKGNLFLGYSKNLGSSAELTEVYTRGPKNINQMFRIAPSYTYNLKHFNLGLEYEATSVEYGAINPDYTVEGDHTVTNHRICALVKYNF